MNSKVIKTIETEKKFATAVYKNFTAMRFGMTPCCILDMEKAAIKKELCDWEDLKFKDKMGLREKNIQQCKTASEKNPVTWTSIDLEALLERLDILETLTLEDEKDLNYIHNQPVASATWTITHDLDKKPSVRIENLTGDDIIGEIDYVNTTTLVIIFAVPVAGTAYLN